MGHAMLVEEHCTVLQIIYQTKIYVRNDTPYSLMFLSLCSVSRSACVHNPASATDAPTSALAQDSGFDNICIHPLDHTPNLTW